MQEICHPSTEVTIGRNRNHDFSEDIDLFGEDSLFRYLNRTVTGYGREILSGWVADPFNYRSAAYRIKQLSSIIRAFDNCLNIFAGLVFNGLILWDFQCLFRMEKWKKEAKGKLPLWLKTVGEADTLISLSNHVSIIFDFKLREGITKKMNAAILMKQMGII